MSQSGVRRNDHAALIHPHPQPAARRRLQAARQPRVALGVAYTSGLSFRDLAPR
jgi:hypothetical protein